MWLWPSGAMRRWTSLRVKRHAKAPLRSNKMSQYERMNLSHNSKTGSSTSGNTSATSGGNSVPTKFSEKILQPKTPSSTSILVRTILANTQMRFSLSTLGAHISRWPCTPEFSIWQIQILCHSAQCHPAGGMTHLLYGLIWIPSLSSWQKTTVMSSVFIFSVTDLPHSTNIAPTFTCSLLSHTRGDSRHVTWSFFEASHGKGAPDGVGAALKRQADTLVRQGKDIPDAHTFFQLLNNVSKVTLFYVKEEEVEKKESALKPLSTIKGTMKIHEVISVSPGQMKYRDISCFCQAADGVFDCSCYCLQEVALAPLEEAISHPSNEFRPTVIEPHHCGQWCVVQYDNSPYPGIILQVEEGSVQVKCMHSNGVNMFYWPSPRDDVTWYEDRQVMCLIQEPLPLNRRAVQIEKRFWEFIKEQLL